MRNFSINNIEYSDCLDYLKRLPDESVDLVLTDPPYNIGVDGGRGWDSQWKTEQEYLDWCIDWSRECIRVLKDNRMFIVFGTLKTDTFLRYKLELNKFDGIFSQNEIIWSYNWGGREKTNFGRKHEYAWCYSKGKKFLFNSENILQDRKVNKSLRDNKEYVLGTIPTCVWEVNNHTMSKDYCGWHTTTKNLNFLERMIRAYTNDNDLVLDCFMGSGSTAIACKRTGRDYIGCEKSEEYYPKMIERVSRYDRLTTLTQFYDT